MPQPEGHQSSDPATLVHITETTKQKRIKPVVPAKPAYIPPLPSNRGSQQQQQSQRTYSHKEVSSQPKKESQTTTEPVIGSNIPAKLPSTNPIGSSVAQSRTLFEQSSKNLEQVLAQRLEKDQQNPYLIKIKRPNVSPSPLRTQSSSSPSSVPSQLPTTSARCDYSQQRMCTGPTDQSPLPKVHKHVKDMLQNEMKMHCKSIQEKHLIQKRLPQTQYKPATEDYFMLPVGADKRSLVGIGGDDAANGTFNEDVLIYRDANLISGSLNALTQHLVPTTNYYPERTYIFAFLLSARLFVQPYELLERIGQLYDEQNQRRMKVDYNRSSTSANACCTKRFLQMLGEWTETFPYDFRDSRMMDELTNVTRKHCNASRQPYIDGLRRDLLDRLRHLEQYEKFLDGINATGCETETGNCNNSSGGGGGGSDGGSGNDHHQRSQSLSGCLLSVSSSITSGGSGHVYTATTAPTGTGNGSGSSSLTHSHHNSNHPSQHYCNSGISPSSTASTSSASGSISSQSVQLSTHPIDITELCANPIQLAHQLTHIELERLSHIGPEEFVQSFAKDNPHLDTMSRETKKTRNLESYVQWFNRLSYLVVAETVKHSKKKQRVRVIEYWIETARECFNIGNFNSLMAIIAGLNMSPVSRLKKTWAKVQSAKFLVLEHQMDPSSNFNSYRSTLKAAMWRSEGATDERQRIVIPFFSLLVKDLYFLNEGCSNRLTNGHINFEKFWQLAKQVTEFITWKQVTCPFEKLPKIMMFLQTYPLQNENGLAVASFECEPPDNTHEKDRYKTLKTEQNHN